MSSPSTDSNVPCGADRENLSSKAVAGFTENRSDPSEKYDRRHSDPLQQAVVSCCNSLSLDPRIQDEYKILRGELETNRKFVFERPLLITAASIVALPKLVDILMAIGMFASFFIILFFYNLWFTANRLRSNARILGYLRVVHEGPKRNSWIGWESALLKYRDFCLNFSDRVAAIRKKWRRRDQYDTRRFYGPIYWFHIIGASVVLLGGVMPLAIACLPAEFQSLQVGGIGGLTMAFSILSILVFIGACVLAAVRWHPRNIRNSIEAEAEIWELIFP